MISAGDVTCDEYVTEMQEQCVQDDVSLASCAAELARTVGEEETREAYDVVAGPSLDHRDDVEQLLGHQAVAYVTKILNTNESILTESLREKAVWRQWSSTASRATRLSPK